MNSGLDVLSVLEAAILCSEQPLSTADMCKMLEADSFLKQESITDGWLSGHLMELQQRWQGRGLELVEVAGGWRFQSVAALTPYLERVAQEQPARYSRASMETLAIIAYRQPCTRGDIEEIRGVTVSSQIIKQFEDRGWVEVVGYRDTVGRPALLATTQQFLQDMGIQDLTQLPPIDTNTLEARAEHLQVTLLQDTAR